MRNSASSAESEGKSGNKGRANVLERADLILKQHLLMATDDYIPAKRAFIHENAVYFEASDITEVDGDYFGISNECHQYLIKSKGKCLLLDDNGEFQKQFLPTQQQNQSGCRCNIQIYHDSNLQERQVKPVMLYFIIEDKKMVACCRNLNDVYPEAMDPPRQILDDAHKAVFYLKRLPSVSNKYMFQSSLYPSQYLGFESDEQHTFLHKLVLREVPRGEVSEFCEFSLFQSN